MHLGLSCNWEPATAEAAIAAAKAPEGGTAPPEGWGSVAPAKQYQAKIHGHSAWPGRGDIMGQGGGFLLSDN